MSVTTAGRQPLGGRIRVRYWASARAAVGVESEHIQVSAPVSLVELRRRVLDGREPALTGLLAICSVLVDGDPVSSRSPEEVTVKPGQTVEFLPPFAGG